MQDYHLIYSKALDFCKYLIPQTPREIGGVCLAAITTIFYSTRIGLVLGVGYIGLKSWTWMYSEPKPSKTDAVARPQIPNTTPNVLPRRILDPTPDVLAKEQIMMPNGELFGMYCKALQSDTRKIPRPYRFFDILTSCYKPLGYWGQNNAFGGLAWALPSETTLQWVVAENDKIAGNCRLKLNADEITLNRRSPYFYNENYLKKLLETNFHIFAQYKKKKITHDYAVYNIFRLNIFDENGHVKEEGLEFFIRHHWDVTTSAAHAPLLALVHAAFGDQALCNPSFVDGKKIFQLINIPDEPGLRDVIALHEQFPNHEWRTIQSLLRAYNDVAAVSGLLQKLPPGNLYYVGEDNQIVPTDDSCNFLPIYLRNAEFNTPRRKKLCYHW